MFILYENYKQSYLYFQKKLVEGFYIIVGKFILSGLQMGFPNTDFFLTNICSSIHNITNYSAQQVAMPIHSMYGCY